MAHEASINQLALRVAEVFHRHAQSKGWSPDDYHVFMKFNTDYFILNIYVVARAFGGRSERQRTEDYDDLWDAIQAGAKGELRAINSVGLVLRGFEEFALYPPAPLKPSEIEIDEKLINHGISWSDPSLPAAR